MAQVLDCHSKAKDERGRKLSNFYPWSFVLDGVRCGSIEGFLQSLKFEDEETQHDVAQLHGYRAFKIGQEGNSWKERQVLYWLGREYNRDSPAYQALLTSAYDALLDQNAEVRDILRSTAGLVLDHTMGKNDSHDTVLTRAEYVRQLDRLRWRALGDD